MYGRLYYIIYSFFNSKKNHDPTFNTACLVFISQFIHVFIAILIFQNFISFNFPVLSEDRTSNKMVFLPIVGIWLIALHLYFSKKIKILTNKYNDPPSAKSFYAVIILVVIIPLLVLTQLAGGIWK